MKSFIAMVDRARIHVRSGVRILARILNRLSHGKISPNAVTMTGVVAHVLIAFLIAGRNYVLAAVLLIIFGLFDTLDGELARLQNKTSKIGMMLDSAMDRLKEILLYIGVAYAFVATYRPGWAVWAVAACGMSLLVSYMNAWGEAVSGGKRKTSEINHTFRSGFMTFEVRMVILVVALFIDRLDLAVVIIAITAWWTAMNRLLAIINKLEH